MLKWIDKVDGEDDCLADDPEKGGINQLAQQVINNTAKIPIKHSVNDYQIPEESTILCRIQNTEESPYTIVEISSPESAKGLISEATLTLMREQDSESGGAEFIDLYNNGYADSRQMGLRIQSRGTGELRDFVFEFNDGTGAFEVCRVTPDGLVSAKNIVLQKSGWNLIEFKDESGEKTGHVGRGTDKLSVYNSVSESVVDLKDDGNILVYSPSGSIYTYLDDGEMYLNDDKIQTQADINQLAQQVLKNTITISAEPPSGGIWLKVVE